MEPQALDDIHRFTASVDHEDLFSYLGVERDTEKNALIHALRVRRSWAQGQQANPKFRIEALWLIKNIELVKDALTTNQRAYINDLEQREERRNLETLSMFIKGTLADGDLTVRGEEAIQQQGEALGLPESVVIRRIGEILAERDAGTNRSPEPPMDAAVEVPDTDDLYAILDASPDATEQELEDAYRKRYRWARQLRDTDKSSRVYSLLDEAWRVLQDPARRAEYDDARIRDEAQPSSVEPSDGAFRVGFLPPPPPTNALSLPTPSVEKHLASVLETDEPVIATSIDRRDRPAPPPPTVPPMGDWTPEATEENQTPPEPGEERPRGPVVADQTIEPLLDPLVDLEAPEQPEPLAELDLQELEPKNPVFADFNLEDLDMGLNPPSDGNDAGLSIGPYATSTEVDALNGLDGDLMDEPSLDSDGLNIGDPDNVLSAGQIYNNLAELRVEGPRLIRIRTGNHPFPVRITVANAGAGSMPTTVRCDAPWVQISPPFLDPDRPRQTIEALVEPDGMPGNAAKATLTIEAEHGETETVVIDALKYVVSPLTMLVSATVTLIVFLLIAAGHFLGMLGSDIGTPTNTILAVSVNPPAGEVYINDELVGNQGTLSLVDSFPTDTPLQVRVELDGFEPFLREVTLKRGESLRIEADLVLRDAVAFVPEPGMVEAELDTDAVDAALAARKEHFDNCFTRNLRTNTPFGAEIEVTCTVTNRGFIHGVSFGAANFRSPAVQACLRRQLRALKLPLIPGDYARFERVLGVDIQPRTALNDEINP